MWRVWVAGVAVAGLLVAGCTAGDEDEPPATAVKASAVDPTVPTPAGEVGRLQPGASTDEIFVAVVHDGGVHLLGPDLIKLGHTVCRIFRAGATFSEYMAGTRDTSLSVDQRAVLAGAAVGSYCPDQESKIPGRG